MPNAELLQLIDRVRRRLLAIDGVLAAGMIDAYGAIWVRISREVDVLLEQIMGQQMTFAQVQQVQRYQTLLLEARARVERYAAMAEGNITAVQRQMVSLSQASVRGIVDAALPPGVDTVALTRVGVQWVRLPAEAFEMFVGIAGDGSPLANLLAPLGQEASIGIREELRDGIALGRGPRETARLIRQRFGMPLTRSLNIARTETLRAFRESSRLQYAANSNIVRGWERRSARDDRVCGACLALDGERYEVEEPINAHPGDRCAMVPVTIGYRDLGLDVDTPEGDTTTSRDWFEEQPETTQRAMMGKGKFEAWQAGRFGLKDMAKITHDPVWGDAAIEKPLKELIGI